MPRLLVTTAPLLEAAQHQARLASRAAVTARLEGMPWGGFAMEACCWSLPATLDELSAALLTMTRIAAAALGCEPATLLGAVQVARTAAAYQPAVEG